MSTRLVPLSGGLAIGALVALMGTACVDSHDGAFIEVVLDQNVPAPAHRGDAPVGAQPPSDTYLSFYAIQYDGATECVDRCDEDTDCPTGGTCNDMHRCVDENDAPLSCPAGSTCNIEADVCVDDATNSLMIEDSYAFKVVDFEIRSLIDLESPCFIENPERPYPGLHTTKEAERMRLDLGIDDPFNPPPGTDEGDVIDILTADTRQGFLPRIEGELKAVVSFSNALPPGEHPDFPVATACVEDDPSVNPNAIPPPDCIGDESNARRLALCQAFWDRYPAYYEGNDLVFTLPLNGDWRGAVTGTNPKNGIGPLDGAAFFVDTALDDFDALVINWQYKDYDGDGAPDYPGTVAPEEQSSVGYHFLEGYPQRVSRGVLNVPLSNRIFSISGEAVVFPTLGDDDVQF